MKEVEPDEKWQTEETKNAPTESELVIITLLIRLYDAQMAILREMNPQKAQELYDAHDAGENWNPRMYVMDNGQDS